MESIRNPAKRIRTVVQLGVVTLLLSKSWQYLYWDSPLRTLVWDEDLFSPVITSFGWSWTEWVTSEISTHWIQQTTFVLGLLLLIVAISTILLLNRFPQIACSALILATILCLFDAILQTKAHFGRIGHFAELSLQWMSPMFLVFVLRAKMDEKWLDYLFRSAIALTFIGHGLYACGYYPVPGHFQQMMISGFGVTNDQALLLLKIAGYLDFIAAGILFLPSRKWAVWGLYYIILWGFLTAFARLWSHSSLFSMENLLSHWLFECTIRWVHFLIPLALLLIWKKNYSKSDQ